MKRTTHKPGEIVAYRRRPRKGEILCHNHVLHGRDTPHGQRGFRWFSVKLPAPGWQECPCAWRPDLGTHYAWSEHVKFWRSLKKRLRTQEAVDRYINKQIARIWVDLGLRRP
jgi:hypothetical protein